MWAAGAEIAKVGRGKGSWLYCKLCVYVIPSLAPRSKDSNRPELVLSKHEYYAYAVYVQKRSILMCATIKCCLSPLPRAAATLAA